MSLTEFDASEHITSTEDALEYLTYAFEGGDIPHILSAIGEVIIALRRISEEPSK